MYAVTILKYKEKVFIRKVSHRECNAFEDAQNDGNSVSKTYFLHVFTG